MVNDEPQLDPYAVLGLEPTADPAEIRAAFRRMVQERHPDTAPSGPPQASVQEVVEAYRILMDLAGRARPDDDRRQDRSTARRIPVRRGPARAVRSETQASRPCPTCHGEGRVVKEWACPDCAATGEITVLDSRGGRRLMCPSCRGRGRRARMITCSRCRGSGSITA